VEGIAAHERALTERFLRGVEPILCDTFRLLGTRDVNRRVGVFSFALEGTAPSVFAWRLEKECGVLVRAGLHCAPLAHGTFGTRTHPLGADYAGATRLSVGAFTTMKDVERAVRAVEWCATSVVGVG
jgi:selenocysteine lyase/cysteine desulfurase